MYMHDLIKLLESSGFGFHVTKVFIACMFFADDLLPLSPAREGLQKLLNVCVDYCRKFCLDFNVKKSKVMIVGKPLTNVKLSAVFLKNEPLEQVSDCKYLGVILCAGKVLTFSPIASIRSFHRAANAILYSRVKPNNEILLKLLYMICVPILSYAAAIRDYSA